MAIMKKPRALLVLFCCLLVLLALNSCATRPALAVESAPPETIPPVSPDAPAAPVVSVPAAPERIPSRVEVAINRVQRNDSSIERFFILDENRQIITKAVFSDNIGDFEIVYNLAEAVPLSDSVFEVGFILTNNESGRSYEDTLIWRPLPGREGLLLSMDDDHMENWEEHFDLFDKYGARFTFFVQGAFEPEILGPFLISAVERGHDVGYHSLNHLDLRRVTEEVFFVETVSPLEEFKRRGISFSSFAYPFGFSQPWMHEALLDFYGVTRGYGVTYRIYTEEEIREGYIISRAIDNTVLRGEENFDNMISVMLRTLKFLGDGRILPLTSHIIEDDAAWGISLRRLEFLLETAVNLGLKFYLFSDFM